MLTQTIFPAEWAPQAGILLTWPHSYSDWRPLLAEVDATYAALAAQIGLYEIVVIVCHDAAHRDHVQALLAGRLPAERIRLHVTPSNDTWTRDYGPITVYRNGQPIMLNFCFNGWGGKFPHELDDRVSLNLHAAGAFGATPLERIPLILEGGSIESDGQGTLLSTHQCLLTETRNGLSRAELEARLAPLLGIRRFLWLDHGHLAGDDTDGHIDTLARFCDPETIAYQSCENPADEHFESLRAMEEQLRRFRTAKGKPYRLVPLPLPEPKYDPDNQRLPAGYANFLILNRAVLAPTYDDPSDAVALARLSACFPGREVRGVQCLPLIRQHGSLHCITMQLPEGIVLP